MPGLLLDIRYALRVLRRSPAFTLVALVTLMLGIGANAVVFGVLHAVLLHPLAVSDPRSLYQLRHQRWMSGRLLTHSYPAFEDFRRRNTTFSGMAAVYGYAHAALQWGNATLNVSGDAVTANYFDLLGVQPGAGRFFHASDEHGANSAPYVVLSDDLWRRAFQADRRMIGTVVQLDRQPFTVVGIAPASFHGLERFVWPDYWMPIGNQGQAFLETRTAVDVTVIGRLKSAVTPPQAIENINAIAADLAKEYPQSDDGQPLRLIHPGLWGDDGDVIRGFLWSVNVLALLVLAAACANLASLFAARAADRRRELALRSALGSGRGRLVRQLLTEALMVSLLGGAAGLLGAQLLLATLNRWPRAAEVHLDARLSAPVYLTGLALTLASALFFGLIPARQAWQSDPLHAMKGGALDALRPRRLAARDLLLGAQIAICTLLVTASLVAVRGMERAIHAPLGIQPQGVVLADVDLSQTQQETLAAVRTLAGVTAAGIVNRMPLTGGIHGIPIFRPGTTDFRLNNAALTSYLFQISPGYFEAAGTRLLDGRDISWHDSPNTPAVAIVNKTFARQMWGKQPALGQRFVVSGKLTEVVGMVEDGKYHDLQESPQPVVFLPSSHSAPGETVLVVRSRRAPGEMAAALGRTLRAIEPDVPITLQSWPDQLTDVLFPARAATLALGVMGLLAFMLAVTGIFGMAAYSVSRRMKELGIRLALGAGKMQVMRVAVGRPMLLLAAGSLLGLLAGISASRLLEQIVYQANPREPAVLGGAALIMALLGIAAAAIPVRRALAADPSQLLRDE